MQTREAEKRAAGSFSFKAGQDGEGWLGVQMKMHRAELILRTALCICQSWIRGGRGGGLADERTTAIASLAVACARTLSLWHLYTVRVYASTGMSVWPWRASGSSTPAPPLFLSTSLLVSFLVFLLVRTKTASVFVFLHI